MNKELIEKLAELEPVGNYCARRLTPEGTKEFYGYLIAHGLDEGAPFTYCQRILYD